MTLRCFIQLNLSDVVPAGDYLIVGASGHDENALADTGPESRRGGMCTESDTTLTTPDRSPGPHTSSPEALAGNSRSGESSSAADRPCRTALGKAAGQ